MPNGIYPKRRLPERRRRLPETDRELYLIDIPNNMARVFDVPHVPAPAPRQVGTISPAESMIGSSFPNGVSSGCPPLAVP